MAVDRSAALARREQVVHPSAYERFTETERALIHRTVAPGTTPEELLMFLTVCAQNNLDPFAREAWCIKMPGRNGAEGKVVMIVGKYGWSKVMERHSDYQGTRHGVVYENDTFIFHADPRKLPSGVWTHIEHSFQAAGERGRLVGAYAEGHREGRPPEFFFARLDQYQPFDTKRRYDDQEEREYHGLTVFLSKRDLHSPWLSQTDTMIDKCAQTTVWRNLYPLGALYGEEEMSSAMQPVDPDSSVETEIEWGEDPEIAVRLRQLVGVANELKANTWPDAKLRLMLSGMTDEERQTLITDEIIPSIRKLGGDIPDPPMVAEAEAVEEAEDGDWTPLGSVGEPEGDAGEPETEPPPQEETLPGV